MTNVWQVTSAPENRSYANIFIRNGVALITPGDTGAWSLQRANLFEDDIVRRFAEDVQVDDIILLRSGASSIHAVGIIASEYIYLPQFDDVNGWDLQHARRVRWFVLPEVYDFGAPVFGSISQRFSRVNRNDVIDYAHKFINSPPDHWKNAPLPMLPDEQPLMDRIPENLQGLVAQVQDLASLYLDESHFGDLPAEDELLAHYIIPLLRALGWSVEQIGIKWRYVDVTTFRALPRTPENIQFLIEAKRIGVGAESALKQALGYLEALDIQRDVIVTDGIRYRLFSSKNGYKPTAYANLGRLKESARELFDMMRKL